MLNGLKCKRGILLMLKDGLGMNNSLVFESWNVYNHQIWTSKLAYAVVWAANTNLSNTGAFGTCVG